MAAVAGFEASATGGHVWQQWLGLRWWLCVAAVDGFEASATGGRSLGYPDPRFSRIKKRLGLRLQLRVVVCGSSGWV